MGVEEKFSIALFRDIREFIEKISSSEIYIGKKELKILINILKRSEKFEKKVLKRYLDLLENLSNLLKKLRIGTELIYIISRSIFKKLEEEAKRGNKRIKDLDRLRRLTENIRASLVEIKDFDDEREGYRVLIFLNNKDIRALLENLRVNIMESSMKDKVGISYYLDKKEALLYVLKDIFDRETKEELSSIKGKIDKFLRSEFNENTFSEFMDVEIDLLDFLDTKILTYLLPSLFVFGILLRFSIAFLSKENRILAKQVSIRLRLYHGLLLKLFIVRERFMKYLNSSEKKEIRELYETLRDIKPLLESLFRPR